MRKQGEMGLKDRIFDVGFDEKQRIREGKMKLEEENSNGGSKICLKIFREEKERRREGK